MKAAHETLPSEQLSEEKGEIGQGSPVLKDFLIELGREGSHS